MPTAPRYIGTDTATAVAYALDVWGADLFATYFDLDGDGLISVSSADERAFVRAVIAAEGEVDEALGASGGAPFVATAGNPIPDAVRETALMLVPWCATRYRVMADASKSSARVLYTDAQARLRRLATDNGARLQGASGAVLPSPLSGLAAIEAPASFFGDPASSTGFGGSGGY